MTRQRTTESLPLRLGVAWLGGTFALFLVVGETARVEDMTKLVGFVAATIVSFAVGYKVKIGRWPSSKPLMAKEAQPDEATSARLWVLVSGIYAGVFGLALLSAYGASSPAEVLDALRNPGQAYFYRLREATLGTGSLTVQMLTLGAALVTPLVPFTIVFWDRLTLAPKVVALAGAVLYCSYWVFIGTQKGLGDFVVFAVLSMLVRGAVTGRRAAKRQRRAMVLLGLVFAVYMVFNQSDRLVSQNTTAGIQPNPVASAIFGEEIGRGVTTALGYPTHGYLGLAFNLQAEGYEWTKGRGAARAVDSYWTQYVGGTSVFTDTYPARTERQQGWPALMYWATMYPWLASDLTWWGVFPFMALAGYLTAKFWLEAIYLGRKLALLLLCQFGILVAYVPANFQLGITRPGLIAFITLLSLYGLSRVNDALGKRLHPSRYQKVQPNSTNTSAVGVPVPDVSTTRNSI